MLVICSLTIATRCRLSAALPRGNTSAVTKPLPLRANCGRYWSFHNLGDIFLFKMKVMLYILWYAPGWEDVTAQLYWRRCAFVLSKRNQAGKGVAEIAKLLGVHWGSVSRWLTKWRRDGQRALKERKATGRPPKLDCKRHGKAILKLVKHPATEFGYEHPLWTFSVLGKLSALN